MTTEEPKRPAENWAALAEACERDLRRRFPGYSSIDRDLLLTNDERADARRVDWIGVDATGRLLLVLFVVGRAEETILLALEAIAFARASGAELAAHLLPRAQAAGRAIDAQRVPRTVLVAEAFDARVVRALSPLDALDIVLLETGVVRTHSGTHVTLTAVGATEYATDEEPAAVLARWPSEAREPASRIASRLQRLGSNVRCVAGDDAVCWMIEDEPLAWMRSAPVGLLGGLSAQNEPRPLDGDGARELFLDDVVRTYLRHAAESPSAAAALRPEGELLTAEEIAAFRD